LGDQSKDVHLLRIPDKQLHETHVSSKNWAYQSVTYHSPS
jgi:hypothetical protein